MTTTPDPNEPLPPGDPIPTPDPGSEPPSPSDPIPSDPVPGNPTAKPVQALLTLTTCNPRWASYQRLIVFGHLQEARAKADGPPTVLLRPARSA